MFARHAFPPLKTVIGLDDLGAFGEIRLIEPLRPGRLPSAIAFGICVEEMADAMTPAPSGAGDPYADMGWWDRLAARLRLEAGVLPVILGDEDFIDAVRLWQALGLLGIETVILRSTSETGSAATIRLHNHDMHDRL